MNSSHNLYLVYEKNYIPNVDCIEEDEMKLFSSSDAAQKDMESRKRDYEENSFYVFLPSDSDENCFVFADNSDKNNKKICICLHKISVKK